MWGRDFSSSRLNVECHTWFSFLTHFFFWLLFACLLTSYSSIIFRCVRWLLILRPNNFLWASPATWLPLFRRGVGRQTCGVKVRWECSTIRLQPVQKGIHIYRRFLYKKKKNGTRKRNGPVFNLKERYKLYFHNTLIKRKYTFNKTKMWNEMAMKDRKGY